MTTINNFYVKNQFTMETASRVIFQSYKTIICVFNKKENVVFINSEFYKYSRTTTKYFNKFMSEHVSEKAERVYIPDIDINLITQNL